MIGDNFLLVTRVVCEINACLKKKVRVKMLLSKLCILLHNIGE